MADATATSVAAAAATVVPGAPPAEDLTDAAAAALAWLNAHVLDPFPDDDPAGMRGAGLLCLRMYHDTPLPSGALAVLDDPTLSGPGQPEDPARHLHHYWDHLTAVWGVA